MKKILLMSRCLLSHNQVFSSFSSQVLAIFNDFPNTRAHEKLEKCISKLQAHLVSIYLFTSYLR